MKVIKTSDVAPDIETTDLFYGGGVRRQRLVNEKLSKTIRVMVVNFDPGAKTRWHVHTFDHALYVIEGKGIVATEQEEHVFEPGMTAFVSAGEKHWQGAAADSSFSFVAIATPGETSS